MIKDLKMNKKQIESSAWQERLQTFTSGNKNRIAAIAAQGMTVVENSPLVSVDYDPSGKGNAITITLEGFAHTVNAPVELYLTEEANGVVSTLEVVDQNGASTFLRLL
jgi:hypothetical protein